MDVAKLKVDRTYASAVYREIITAGLVGTTISVEYAPGIWDGLTKTVVFRGSVSKDVITNDTTIEIPPEVLTEPNKRLSVGFCGMDHKNRLVIPTIWADLGLIQPGADPSGDASTNPSLPVWGQIASRVEEIAEDVEQLKQAGGAGSGGNVDLTGYATEQYVKEYAQPKGEYLTAVPEGYAKTEDIPTKVSELDNDSGYLTEHQSLDGYAKTEDIPTKPEDIGAQPSGSYLTEVPSGYATEEYVRNKIAEAELGGEEVDLSGYAQKSELPTKVSQLENDKGYLTEHQDISGYAKKSELPTKVSQLQNDSGYLTAVPDGYAKTEDIPKNPADIGAQPEGDYALRSEIPSVPVKSVNGKTGAVSLTATDVKARPDSWMPTASDVGALPKSTVIPTVPTKVSAFTNDAGYLTEHQDISGLAEKFKPTAYGLPVLYLTGDITGMNKDNAVSLSYVYGDRTGSCTLKWQGSSSLAYDKKNYTIKFDTEFEAVEGWGAQKKYCLKANYIDFSHSRNIVNAKLWGQIVKSRTPENATLNVLPNGGAVDGFPVMVVMNGVYEGLYTFNIPKDGWMYGMGSGAKEAILCADAMTPATLFNATATLNGDFELEYVTDENDSGWVLTSLNALINAVKNNNNANFKTAVSPYLDLESAIDYYIFTVLLRGYDMVGKNYILHTYDGTKWAFGAYDMDCTYGLEWDGSAFMTAGTGTTFTSCASNHILFSRLKKYMSDAIKARYDELRNSIMSEDQLVTTFANFIGRIPKAVYDEECKVWTMLPNTATNNLSQIQDWYRRRVKAIDAEVAEVFAETEPSGPVNLVETATDTDGSIYNGTGYKDGWRFKSSSGEEAVQSGSVITGYIPCQEGDKFKVSGVEWGTNTAMGFYTVCGLWNAAYTYVGGNSGNDPSNTYVQRLTTEETGDGFIFQVTEPCAFIRFSMKGSGVNMVVTKIE